MRTVRKAAKPRVRRSGGSGSNGVGYKLYKAAIKRRGGTTSYSPMMYRRDPHGAWGAATGRKPGKLASLFIKKGRSTARGRTR